jgi:hypothetical protein
MLTDLQICDLLQAQYDADSTKFNVWAPYGEVSWALLHDSDHDLLCFEGSHDLPDWQRDFKAEMIQVEGLGGVHAGFYSGLLGVQNAILPLLQKDKPTVISGHSLGAGEAHIFTGMLAKAGLTQLETVGFGSPLPGDQQLSDVIAPFSNRSYWNYKNPLEHDFVGDVPISIPDERYVVPHPRIEVCQPPVHPDPWLALAWHHLSLYRDALAMPLS